MVRASVRLGFILACGALVFTMGIAGRASAEKGSEWRVEGKPIGVFLSPLLKASLVNEAGALLLPEIYSEFQCRNFELLNAKLGTEGQISSGFKIRLSGCE